MKSLFEQNGGTYTMQGDYRLPNVSLPPEEERPIGVWGQRRLRYLKQRHITFIIVPILNNTYMIIPALTAQALLVMNMLKSIMKITLLKSNSIYR